MRILHISDTHGQHSQLRELPEADILVHSGDFTFSGTEAEAYEFMNWLCDLPYRHKLFIAGNHDDCLYGADGIDGLPDDVHYLCNSGIEIEGIKFYGVPLFMQDIMDGVYEKQLQAIPFETNILITHQPPYGICDVADYGSGPAHHGDKILRSVIDGLHLEYHLFGHEHDAYGTEKVGNTVFSNASLLDIKYNMKGKPKLFVYENNL